METKKIDSFSEENRFLSNFWPVVICYENRMYPTVEHAYQAQKTTQEEKRQKVAALITPGEAKKFGENLKRLGKIRPDWSDDLRIQHMTALVRRKFSLSNLELSQKLLATGDIELIEGNTWDDTFFGVCNGEGENHLGKIIMATRTTLKTEVQKIMDALVKHNGKRRDAAKELNIVERTLRLREQVFGILY